jgi:2-C-methyl-D-erythritol 4-phosphate cytidylyltransferase
MSDLCWAVVPAAGAGKRMASSRPKQYLSLLGRQVIEHTLDRLLSHGRIQAACVALSPEDEYWPLTTYAVDERIILADGGQERCHTVLNALKRLETVADQSDWVLVHDAARPCLRHEDLDRLLNTLREDDVGGLLGIPLHDTVKQADEQSRIEATLPRERLWRAFTPQMFRLGALKEALELALARHYLVTDDASAMELAGFHPKLVEGHTDNIKITRPEDLALAEFYLRRQSAGQ